MVKTIRRMLINAAERTESRIAVVSEGRLEEYYTQRSHIGGETAGNIYLGIVVSVERSLQAAFLDIGGRANGFLQVDDISYKATEMDRGSGKKGRASSRAARVPIQSLLRGGQEILVQVTKEAIGTKGPSLTTFISVPGRYLVLMPYSTHIGVSKKIEDDKLRKKLISYIKELSPPKNMGFIIRTAGADRTKRELQKDLDYLSRLWKVITEKMKSASHKSGKSGKRQPALVYKESDLAIRTVRDIFTPDIGEIIVDSREVHRALTDFFQAVMPRYKGRIKLHDSALPLFDRYDVESMVEEIYSPVIALPQGGSIVIEETEALVAIDVNSGRFKTRSARQASFKLNMQAAEEITRQIRLRDLGGLIVIDFIDMKDTSQVRQLEQKMRAAFRADRARLRLTRISEFGIMQITRQRLRPSLLASSSGVCPHCGGTGRIRNLDTISLGVFRKVKAEISRTSSGSLKVLLHPQVAQHFQNMLRTQLVDLESMYNKKIIVCSEPFAQLREVKIEQAGK